jgi:hypothetical protein
MSSKTVFFKVSSRKTSTLCSLRIFCCSLIKSSTYSDQCWRQATALPNTFIDNHILRLKTKTMAFWESHAFRTETIVVGHILEQASRFQYLSCEISYACDKDVEKNSSPLLRYLWNNTKGDAKENM